MIRSLPLLLLLAGCSAYEPPHGDYLFHVSSLDRIQALYEKAPNKVPMRNPEDIGAFTLLGTDPCRIFIAAEYWDYLWKHEVRHCEKGAYHD